MPSSATQFKPGNKLAPGRTKGVPNKLNATIKEMVIGALHQAGGQDYLAKRAEDCPVAFLALLGRVLPLQLTGAEGKPISVDFRWADAGAPPNAEDNQPLTIEAEHQAQDAELTLTYSDAPEHE